MPYSSNNGGGRGPWGGGNGGRGKGPWGSGGGGGGGDGGQQGPDLDDLLRKGRDQLRVVLGGKGGNRGGRGGGGGGDGPRFEKLIVPGVVALLVVAWLMQSFYRVDTGEESVELWLGEFDEVGTAGLNFAFWPLATYDILPVERENVVDIGTTRSNQGLMLTGDENIVDIGFQVVWNIREPNDFLFNLAEPQPTIEAVSESAMREVVARSRLKPILSQNRAEISAQVEELIQTTLDNYQSGVNIVRVNFNEADPPTEVIDAFRDVQAAEQDRQTQINRAQAYANQRLAAARGEMAQILQEAQGYRAQQVNEAKGEAARFESILKEYQAAPDVTRKRLHLETIENVFGNIDKVIIDESMTGGNGGQGVVPYLPLNELRRGGAAAAGGESSGQQPGRQIGQPATENQ